MLTETTTINIDNHQSIHIEHTTECFGQDAECMDCGSVVLFGEYGKVLYGFMPFCSTKCLDNWVISNLEID